MDRVAQVGGGVGSGVRIEKERAGVVAPLLSIGIGAVAVPRIRAGCRFLRLGRTHRGC